MNTVLSITFIDLQGGDEIVFKTLWDFILRLFGKTTSTTTDKQIQINSYYASRYEDIKNINFTSIFSNKLTTLSVTESSVSVVGDNDRAEFLNLCISNVWDKIKKITGMALGTGGCVIVPYVNGGRLLFDIVSQDRIIINKKQGEIIKSATILADSITINDKIYYRWVNYDVIDDIVYITNKTTNETGSIREIEQWKGIEDRAISGVDKVLFAFIKSPVDNKASNDFYGVPITFGCDSIINEIYECLKDIKEEFQLKQVRVFANERLFKKDPKTGKMILPSKAFIAGNTEGTNSMLEEFSPEIRDSSYYNRLLNLFDLFEKSVGTSKGILTPPETRGATATEIKAGLYDTYALITDIRKEIEKGIKDYIYSCDILINYYELASQGEYNLNFDWSYSLIESSSESWAQLKDAQAMGIKSKAEVRQWLNPNESIDEAQSKIDDIKKSEPSLDDILGTDEEYSISSKQKNDIEDNIEDTVAKTLNGAQTQSLINIVMQYKQGTLTEGQAINIIATSIGISKDEATELLRA